VAKTSLNARTAPLPTLRPTGTKKPGADFSAPGMKKPISGEPEIGAHFLSFN